MYSRNRKTIIKKSQEQKMLLTFFLLMLFSLSLFSQQKKLPLNHEWSLGYEKAKNIITGNKENDTINICRGCSGKIQIIYPQDKSCFKPYIVTQLYQPKDKTHKLFTRKLRKENLFIVRDTTDMFLLTIDPLLNFELGKDLESPSEKHTYKNTRGFLIRGSIGKQLSFESSFSENQARFADYINDYNNTYLIVPGRGRWKNFKNDGYDFAMASGYISYSPSRHFNFQAGTGKNFIGDGYRSLLLSDNAFDYPFIRITTSFGKIQYTNLYTSFMNLNDGGTKIPPGIERLFQKKAGNFQFLSWNVHQRVQLGFFQGLIWQASDSMNRQCLRIPYASPIIYTAALSEGLRGKNNVLLGATLKIKITNSISFYGQYMMDDFSRIKNSLHNKTGFQAGIKYFDVLGIKNLSLQEEYNQVRPYSYAGSTTSQSYSHYNAPLAHPLGANFKESVTIINYRYKSLFTELKVNYAIIGKDSTGRKFGNNIFYSDNTAFHGSESTNNKMCQGVKTMLTIVDFHVGYLLNPSTNLNIVAGISNRSSISAMENNYTNLLYIGIRTSLNNIYYDF